MKYFFSDTHFSHNNILRFERPNFTSIGEHDQYISKMLCDYSKILTTEDELWFLGDWGNINFLSLIYNFNCKKVAIRGNHDRDYIWADIQKAFDECYEFPIYISHNVAISHEPIIVSDTSINLHGHLHDSKIDKKNYVNCNIALNNYKMVEADQLAEIHMPPHSLKFTKEDYFKDQVYLHPELHTSLILDKTGHCVGVKQIDII